MESWEGRAYTEHKPYPYLRGREVVPDRPSAQEKTPLIKKGTILSARILTPYSGAK